MPVSSVHQCPYAQGIVPAPPSEKSMRSLGAKASKRPRGRSAEAGSNTMLATYSTTQRTVTALMKFQRRKSVPRVPPKPHMPGLRRPQMRQTGASALVRRPHDGHRMAPDVLRNIVGMLPLVDTIPFIEPDTEVDQPTDERAEWAVRIARPDDVGMTGGTREAMHRVGIVLSAHKVCQLSDFPDAWESLPIDSPDALAESEPRIRALGPCGRRDRRSTD